MDDLASTICDRSDVYKSGADGRPVRLADRRRVLLDRVRGGSVIDARAGDRLGTAVRAAWWPAEWRQREEGLELRRAGINLKLA